MKKSIVAIIVIVLVSLFTAAAMADSKPISQVTIPVNGSGIYYLDPDNDVRTIRTEKVTTQTNVSKYANNGYLTGKRAGDDTLMLGFESHEVTVYGLEIVDFEKLPQEVLEQMISMNNGTITSEQFWSWFCQYTVSRITRIETVRNNVGTTINAEVYDKGIHGEKPVVRLVVGVKASEYWDIFERELNGTKIWTLVMKGKKSGSQQPQVTPTPAPQDVDPEPVWEDPTTPTPAPTEEPWDPGFNFDEDVDPEPVWEDPTPATPTSAPVQDWDDGFNFEEESTPAPQQQDPAPVWEDPAPVVNTPAPAPQQPDPTPAPQQADPAPVWEEPAPAAAPQQQADPAPVWDDAPAATENQPQDDWDAGFNF
jgi:hypothetical protein